MDLLDKVATTALLGFVVSSTMGMGAGLTVRQILGALRNARLVLLALLANFGERPVDGRVRVISDACPARWVRQSGRDQSENCVVHFDRDAVFCRPLLSVPNSK
jgi:hypothetical protein